MFFTDLWNWNCVNTSKKVLCEIKWCKTVFKKLCIYYFIQSKWSREWLVELAIWRSEMFIYCKNTLSNNCKDAHSSRTTPWEGSVNISHGRCVWKSMHLCCVQLDSIENVTEWPDNRFRRVCGRTFSCRVWIQMFLLRAGYYYINKGNFLEKKLRIFPDVSRSFSEK